MKMAEAMPVAMLEEQRTRLEAAIAALEAQRAVLGDAVAELALAPLRRQLSDLSMPAPVPPAPSVEGERKLVTVLFADIAGFTAMSETLDPEHVRSLMNACFEHLVPVIHKYQGTVEHFLGDAVVALFGAPVAHENDPERALRAALAIRDAVPALDRALGSIGLHVRMGI